MQKPKKPLQADLLHKFWRARNDFGCKIKSTAQADADFAVCFFQICEKPLFLERRAEGDQQNVGMGFIYCFNHFFRLGNNSGVNASHASCGVIVSSVFIFKTSLSQLVILPTRALSTSILTDNTGEKIESISI